MINPLQGQPVLKLWSLHIPSPTFSPFYEMKDDSPNNVRIGEMVEVYHKLTNGLVVLCSSHENVAVLCGRILPSLWSFLACIGINLSVV